MSKPIERIFELVFAVFMFLGALVYMMFSTTEYTKSFDDLSNSQTVYNVQTEIPVQVKWTGAQVAGKLYRLTEDDIYVTVDGVPFKTAIDVKNKLSLVNLEAEYQQDVTVDVNGKVTHVTFTQQ